MPRPGPLISPSSLIPGATSAPALSRWYGGRRVRRFENGIYWNDATAHSGSAILVLTSKDGFKWKEAAAEPRSGRKAAVEKKSHVYALDARAIDERTWHLYYNARDDWHWSRGASASGC